VRAIALPASPGPARSGRASGAVEVSRRRSHGRQQRRADRAGAPKARAQIAFYGSTPAYKDFLDHHGWGDLQPELGQALKEGRWRRWPSA
jgi:hypothetical protein